uniref:Carbohydrate sulfotransferase n=1 Tax=Pelodiscus sinensis TaxID=13735 RepID=K7F3V6_PELSI|nr:carbohydrate sulfotransferase 9 isoform X1 [Pelodiscus sinensis]XP_006127255.1 carbohydrate sulfotransferase 9 isoform X1 [Pelodiscus sinensis]XP_014431033.1 carbohydrate sulfotransferase 9 isoform X1 [Pelodiscus sinensis]XP_014431035.1 carbohydrate sulfotransferase 9 isoform X1 [Pelodiscus sinensis]XP_025042485.1 carbohydrate sulfotransferase 9 isoform X1 [Pelodiscus sinensis]XP_025042486.1 carbohydrate sulfotransferase 9 isoform X1 [Pelodiscus sinensis]XP_025042487.1 carbohydrate sulfotr|eukprot:XP_006127254.1 carbohydrate sulfotransferase 9 isoform X1 [Pelodiscus sinensis]
MQPSGRVMNLRQVFVSVLMFGVAGLFLFMYLQAWIEEHHTASGEKLQQQIINQDSKLQLPEDLAMAPKNCTAANLSKRQTSVINSRHSREKARPLIEVASSLVRQLSEQQKMTKSFLNQLKQVNLPPAVRPLNKSLIIDGRWKTTDEAQEKRRSFLYDFCKKYNRENRLRTHLLHMVSRIYVEDRHKILYCEVPKAGCSNWKRILMVLNGLASSAYSISHDAVHYGKHLKKLDSYDLKGIQTRLNTYTKTIFVRDPMERLVSAFRDKFEHPNSYYHPVFGKAIIKKYRLNAQEEALKTGSGVKFKEFIQYLLDSHRPVGMDIHWDQISKLCYPCFINYDFIGKFETLEEDANYFLQLIGAPAQLKFPNFKDRHSSDERTTMEVVRQYLKELSRTDTQLTYDFYYLDYLMFNYTTPVV